MTTSETGEVKIESMIEDEVQIKKILVPLDGSNCSFRSQSMQLKLQDFKRHRFSAFM